MKTLVVLFTVGFVWIFLECNSVNNRSTITSNSGTKQINSKSSIKKYCIAFTTIAGDADFVKFYFFKDSFSRVVDSFELDLRKLKDGPVAGQYNSAMGGNSIQISPDGTKAYILTAYIPSDEDDGDGPDDSQRDTISRMSIYSYNFRTKEIDSILSFPPSDRLLWKLINDGSEIVYCDSTRVLNSYNLNTKKGSKLSELDSAETLFDYRFVVGSNMSIDDNIVSIYYPKDSFTHRYQYSLVSGKSTDKILCRGEDDFASYYGDDVFYFDGRNNNKANLFHNSKLSKKFIHVYNMKSFWQNDNSIFLIDSNAIVNYDSDLIEKRKKSLHKPHIYNKLSDGLFVSNFKGHEEEYSFLSFDFNSFQKVPLPGEQLVFYYIGEY